MPRHGGGIDAAAARWGRPRAEWLDLSTGINPEPYPVPPLSTECWQRLPDAGLLSRLGLAAARCYGAAGPGCVVPAPGSQSLIQWLPRLVPAGGVAVVSPTYNEHAPAWRAAGHTVAEVSDLDAVSPDASAVVVVNPNNPDGRRTGPEDLVRLAEGRLVVVDEAFADTAPELSVAAEAAEPGRDIVVLRSAGKFFGLAGMRLGFAITAPERAEALRRVLGPWAVSGPAAEVGARALADHVWIAATRARLADAARRLDALLGLHGFAVIGGTNLFRLVEDPRAAALYEHLAAAAILTRRFPDRPSWLRIGLPDRDGETRLAAALDAWQAGSEAVHAAAAGR